MSMMKLIASGVELPIEMTDVTLLPETLLAKEATANKGEPNGYAGLDPAGKVSLTNLPSALLLYKGVWNAETNTPTLPATDVNRKFHVYIVSVEGHQFGIDYYVGDWLIYNDAGVAEKSNNSDLVSSVNGYQGHVELDADDLLAGEFNKFVTDDDKVAWDGVVTDSHTHANKVTLDGTEESFTTALKDGYDGAVTDQHTHTNKTDLDNYDPTDFEKAFSTATATSLTIDLATAKYFFVTLSANASFTLSNVTTGEWTFHILNNGASPIDIAIPNTANNIFQAETLTIGAGAVAEISMVSDGTKRVWLLSNELTVGS